MRGGACAAGESSARKSASCQQRRGEPDRRTKSRASGRRGGARDRPILAPFWPRGRHHLARGGRSLLLAVCAGLCAGAMDAQSQLGSRPRPRSILGFGGSPTALSLSGPYFLLEGVEEVGGQAARADLLLARLAASVAVQPWRQGVIQLHEHDGRYAHPRSNETQSRSGGLERLRNYHALADAGHVPTASSFRGLHPASRAFRLAAAAGPVCG